MSANILNLVGKIADFEISSFECNTFEILQFHRKIRSFVWQVPASPMLVPYYSLDLQEQALRVITFLVRKVPASPIPIPFYFLDLQEQALRVITLRPTGANSTTHLTAFIELYKKH